MQPAGPGSPSRWLSGLLWRHLQPPVLELQETRALVPRVSLSPGPHILSRFHRHGKPGEAGVHISFLLMTQY